MLNPVPTLSKVPEGYRHIGVTPICGALGAEIDGVDLSTDVWDDVLAEIRKALNEYLVIFFRDQDLTPDQQKAFGLRFGSQGGDRVDNRSIAFDDRSQASVVGTVDGPLKSLDNAVGVGGTVPLQIADDLANVSDGRAVGHLGLSHRTTPCGWVLESTGWV